MDIWDIAISVVVILAFIAVALWGVYGGKLKPGKKKADGKKSLPVREKKEPVFNSAAQGAQQTLPLDFTPPPLPELEQSWQADYCYVVHFFEDQVGDVKRFSALKERLAQRRMKIYRLLGFDEEVQQWEIAEASSSFRYWIAMVPLADRNGTMTREKMKLLEDDCRRFSDHVGLRPMFSPIASALARADLLDKFCDDVDQTLHLRLLLPHALGMNEVDELLKRGYMVKDEKTYVYRLDSEVMFTASPVVLPNILVQEVSFVLDLPRVSQPQRAFEDMVQRMGEIADLKHGRLFHGEKEISETDFGMMRGEVDALANRMIEEGVNPGSALACLLFN